MKDGILKRVPFFYLELKEISWIVEILIFDKVKSVKFDTLDIFFLQVFNKLCYFLQMQIGIIGTTY